jgi:hypothetical protein
MVLRRDLGALCRKKCSPRVNSEFFAVGLMFITESKIWKHSERQGSEERQGLPSQDQAAGLSYSVRRHYDVSFLGSTSTYLTDDLF